MPLLQRRSLHRPDGPIVVERRVTYIAAILVIVLSGANLYLAWRIFMNQTELAVALTAVSDQLSTVGDQLTKATNEIVAAVGNAGGTTPEVDAAVTKLQAVATSLKSASQALDDLNPDTPTT